MKFLTKLLVCYSLGLALPALAQTAGITAVQTAEQGVKALLQTVEESRALITSDRERYFAAIENVLSSFVDFEAVAEVVMSRYAESATPAQRTRFAGILSNTLTRFYGASLATYNGQELVFLPGREDPADPRADTVVTMELRGGDSTLRIQYQMFLNENDEWKLKNLNLGGINLGRQYFTQFSAAMGRYNNDIDQVLDNWQ